MVNLTCVKGTGFEAHDTEKFHLNRTLIFHEKQDYICIYIYIFFYNYINYTKGKPIPYARCTKISQ